MDEGAKDGDKLTFVLNDTYRHTDSRAIWRARDSIEYNMDFRRSAPKEEIPLGQGWNLISFRTRLSDSSVGALLASIRGNYVYVIGYLASEGVKSWDVNRPGFLNDLKEMDTYHGYWVKMTKPATLVLEGAPMPVDTPIPLSEGWNLISYLPDQPDSISHALASINGLYTYCIGYLNVEGVKSWDGARPSFLNDLKTLLPNHGYWVKMTRAATLKYPTSGYSPSPPAAPALPFGLGFNPSPSEDRRVQPNVATISTQQYPATSVALSPISADFWGVDTDLKVGNLITVENSNGVVCGYTAVNSAGAYLIHVYGVERAARPFTHPPAAGATVGSQVRRHKLLGPRLVVERAARPFTTNQPAAGSTPPTDEGASEGETLHFFINGQWVVPEAGDVRFVPSTSMRIMLRMPLEKAKPGIPESSALFQNFPNPFNPETWIPYQLAEKAHVTITIYDASGKVVRVLDVGERAPGIYTEKPDAAYWDGRNQAGETVASGIYFYCLKAGQFAAQRKLVIMR